MSTATRHKLQRLKDVPLFANLSKPELGLIHDNAHEVEFTPGKTIVRQGSKASDLYVVLEGEVAIEVDGERRPIELGPGDYFGEMSVIDGGPRTASVIAASRVTLLRVPSSTFNKLVSHNSRVARKIMVELVTRLRTQEQDQARW